MALLAGLVTSLPVLSARAQDGEQRSGAEPAHAAAVDAAVVASDLATEPSVGSVVIEVERGADAAPWLAAALEAHIAQALSTYGRLVVRQRDPSVRQTCGDDRQCLLRAYGANEIDIVVLMTAEAEALPYVLYETWTPSEVDRGAIDLDSVSSLIGLRQRLLAVFAPVLTPGGLLDQKPFRLRPRVSGSVGKLRAERLAALLAAVAVFLLMPWGTALLFLSDRRRLWGERGPSIGVSLAVLAVAGMVLFGAVDILAVRMPPWGLGLLGGAAWGVLVVTNVRFVVPVLPGLDRVEHRDVFRLIVAWLVVCGTRILVLGLYYLPFGFLVVEGASELGVSPAVTALWVAPVVGLVARLWLSSWMRVTALILDERLVVGEASLDNPWHREVSRYFSGYLHRTGWPLEPEVIENILFLPGHRAGVYCYGGGGIKARIVIDERLLALAIGARDERDEDEDNVSVPDWTTGFVVAESASSSSRRRPRGHQGAPKGRHRGGRMRGRRGTLVRRESLSSTTGHQRKQLGQAATLLGYVRPEPGEQVPLIADTIEDLEVVRSLLAEHYQWFAPDPDEDHDDTDPTDKDLLFGPLTHAVGQIIRQDSRLGMFALVLADRAERSFSVVRWLHRLAAAVAHRLFGRSAVSIADAYPALHFARHHHLQYLAYRAHQAAEASNAGQTSQAIQAIQASQASPVDGGNGREDHLTVRAGVDELERTSKDILRQVRAEMAGGTEAPSERLPFVRRIVWLSGFFAEPLVDRGDRRLRWMTTALLVLLTLGGLGGSIYRAVQYHPVYVERVAKQARRRQAGPQDTQRNEGTDSHVRNRNASE